MSAIWPSYEPDFHSVQPAEAQTKAQTEEEKEVTYKEAITGAMQEMAKDARVCFVGYGIKYGAQAGGTLKGINPEQLIETPVAENLMVGIAIGLSLKGRIPVVYIERFDFILNALDAIVNHLDKIEPMSKGQFSPRVILRAVAGNRKKPLFTGLTHTQDFTEAVRRMVDFPVIKMESPHLVASLYRAAHDEANPEKENGSSSMLIEMKDLL